MSYRKNRRQFLKDGVLTVAGTVGVLMTAGAETLKRRPEAGETLLGKERSTTQRNRPYLILVFTDQQRFDTIHALGNPVISTPNLDRLVWEGIAFTNAYTPSPVCVPARCSMHYGQYPHNTGCTENADHMPEDGRESFVGALTAAGYRKFPVDSIS